MIESRFAPAALLVSIVLFASVGAAQITLGKPATGQPCCQIVSIDAKAGIVTAKVNANGNVFQFKPSNPATLASLNPGQAVYANFTNHQVSLDGLSPCCQMTRGPQAATAVAAPTARVTGANLFINGPAGVQVVKTNLALTSSSDENAPVAQRGVKSSDDENIGGEKDNYAPPSRMRVLSLRGASSSAKLRRLRDDPNVQTYLDKAKSLLNGFEINTALLAGHKYMINDCLGIKVSAGEFVLKVPDPDLRVDNTGVVLTFAIPHIEMSGFKLRFRPRVTDPSNMCHFSERYGVGASADNVRLELHFDPILDLEKCKIGSMGHITQIWRIGKLRMSPLPTEVSDLAGNIIEDALTNAANFNVADRMVAGFNGVAGLQCHA